MTFSKKIISIGYHLLVIALVIFASPNALAVKLTDLYTAQILVTNNEQQTREAILPQALEQVLIKVSGKVDIAKIPKVQEQLKNAGTLLQSYSYLTQDLGNGEKRLYLRAGFDSNAVRDLLIQTNHGIWNEDRPQILVWLAIPDLNSKLALGKQIFSQTSKNSVVTLLQNHSFQLGFPIILPNMDSEDTNALTKNNNLCDFNAADIKTASKRYSPNAIFVGCLEKNIIGNGLKGHWLLIANDKPLEWQTKADNLDDLLNGAMIKILGAVGTTTTTDHQKPSNVSSDKLIILHVSKVNGLDDYATITSYLRSLPSVTFVELVTMETNGDVILKIINKSDTKSLQETLKNDHRLTVIEGLNNSDTDLYCQWVAS